MHLKVNGYTSMFFAIFTKGNNLLGLPVYFFGWHSPSKMGSTVKGKNLLLWS